MGLFSSKKNNTPKASTKELKKFQARVDEINALEERFVGFSDIELKNKTQEFISRLEKGETLEQILAETFAAVREAARRTLGQRHYDVQLIGGMVLHEGKIAEMRTGEGKTLVATLPVYLNALTKKGVHVVTVNDYLAKRDAAWMGEVYNFLGLSVSVINSGNQSFIYDESLAPQGSGKDEDRDETGFFKVANDFMAPCNRQQAYAADITYGTNSEFGFDYLRDNLVYKAEDIRQTGHPFAIIDEVDSILIDEARTPLIISAPHREAENLYQVFADVAEKLKEGEHYEVDEKMHSVSVNDAGIEKAEEILGIENIYTDKGIKYVHHLETAVRAKGLYLRDKEYVVQNGNIVIVDQSTGRLMPSRRWGDGMHQAIEAKEGLDTQEESRTFASITYQNFFRMYEKLSGMTGTAKSSSEEFFKVYGLDVVTIPTNKPTTRVDEDDLIFQTQSGKFKSIAQKIKEVNTVGQPILVGTVSIENNELLSAFLTKEGIKHELLNAKNHEREAQIVAKAGAKGAVTIATNMAGRGVDIKLGGEDATEEETKEVVNLGGLFVIATERHNARRIDNQLRGRSGRQGDPGKTQFFVSLEDDLMRVFATDGVKKMMGTFGISEDEPIQNKFITKSLEGAQTRIEGFNFDARKNVLSYDDVLNHQRKTIYSRRRGILTGDTDRINSLLESVSLVDPSIQEQIEHKRTEMGEMPFSELIRRITLQTIDSVWVDHLETMDYLRRSVSLRSYGQRDPLVEYKKEGLRLFKDLELRIDEEIAELIKKIDLHAFQEERKRLEQVAREAELARQSPDKGQKTETVRSEAPRTVSGEKIGRNTLVTIERDGKQQTLKYKKAESLLAQGWKLVQK